MEEQQLISRLLEIQTQGLNELKQKWYADAYAFLSSTEGHWWCRHGDVAAGLAEVLRYHDQQPLVQQIWEEMAQQLSCCTDCVNFYHSSKEYFAANFSGQSIDALLGTLQRLDAQRVATALQHVNSLQPGAELPPEAITTLFEALTYCVLLEDAEVAAQLARALLTLSSSYDLALGEGGARYPGVYRLLAHPAADVRSLVHPIVKAWGAFTDPADLEAILPTLAHWLSLLALPLDSNSAADQASHRTSSRPPFRPPAVALWRGMHVVLPLLRQVMHAVLAQMPSMADTLLGALASTWDAEPPGSSGDHAAVHWYAAGCVVELCRGAGREVWMHTGFTPGEVLERLMGAMEQESRNNERLQKGLVEAVREVLCCLPAGDDVVVGPRRRALHFLLHHIPATPGHYPHLTSTLAAHAAFAAVTHALAQGDLSILDDAHFFLPPLCHILAGGGDAGGSTAGAGVAPGNGVNGGGASSRGSKLQGPAHSAALQLACALMAADAAALRTLLGAGEPSAAAGDACDACLACIAATAAGGVAEGRVRAAAEAAAANAASWKCLPALWQALSHCQAAEPAQLLLAAAASLLPSSGTATTVKLSHRHHHRHHQQQQLLQRQGGGGFTLSGFESSVATGVAAAMQLVAAWQLGGYYLESDPQEASPNAVPATGSPAYLAEMLQLKAGELLASLSQQPQQAQQATSPAAKLRSPSPVWAAAAGLGVKGSISSSCGGAGWVVDVAGWPERLLVTLAALLAAQHLALRRACEEFIQSATRQLSLTAAMSALCALHPLAQRHLSSLPAQQAHAEGGQHAKRSLIHARMGASGDSNNPFARPTSAAAAVAAASAALQAPKAAVQHAKQFSWPSRSSTAAAAVLSPQQYVDLTADSPPSSPPPSYRQQPPPNSIPPSHPRSSPVRGTAQQAQRDAQGAAHALKSQSAFYGGSALPRDPSVPQVAQHGPAHVRESHPGAPIHHKSTHPSHSGSRSIGLASVGRAAGAAGTLPGTAGRIASDNSAGKTGVGSGSGSDSGTAPPRRLKPPSRLGTAKLPNTAGSAAAGAALPKQPQRSAGSGAGLNLEALWPEQWPERRAVPALKKPAAPQPSKPVQERRRGNAVSGDVVVWPEAWPDRAVTGTASRPEGKSSMAGGRVGAAGTAQAPEPSTAAGRVAAAALARAAGGSSGAAAATLPQQPRQYDSDSKGARRAAAGAPLAQAAFTIPRRGSGNSLLPPKEPARSNSAPLPGSAPVSLAPRQDAAGRRAGQGGLAVAAVQPAVARPSAAGAGSGGSSWSRLLEDDPFADVAAGAGRRAGPVGDPRNGHGATAAAVPKPQVVRTVIRIAAPPPAIRRGAGAGPVPLWQQRRAAIGTPSPPPSNLPPPLTLEELIQQVLSWHLPSMLSSRGAGALRGQGAVPTRFASLAEYTGTFRGLLMEELRAHLQQSHEESPLPMALAGVPNSGSGALGGAAGERGGSGGECLTLTEVQRRSQFYHLELEAVGEGSRGREQDRESGGLRGEDLVVLVPLRAGQQAGAGAAEVSASGAEEATPYCLAVVDRAERRRGEKERGRDRRRVLHCRVCVAGGASAPHLLRHLTPNTPWAAARLMSLTPHLRQLQALVAAQALPPRLQQELLQPAAATTRPQGSTPAGGLPLVLPSGLREELAKRFNLSQQAAIAAALAGFPPAAVAAGGSGAGSGDQESRAAAALPPAPRVPTAPQAPCFTLIQGPPGTGKTAAIIGMLSALLVQNAVRASKRSRGEGGAEGKHGAENAPGVINPTIRVLVCAQSNAAVDELVSRIATKGLLGRDGAMRQASLVRLGNMEAVSSEAAVYHVAAVAAQLEARDARVGEASGEASQLSSRLQTIRAQLAALQQDIDSLDAAVQASRQHKQAVQQQGRDARQGGEAAAGERHKRRRREQQQEEQPAARQAGRDFREGKRRRNEPERGWEHTGCAAGPSGSNNDSNREGDSLDMDLEERGASGSVGPEEGSVEGAAEDSAASDGDAEEDAPPSSQDIRRELGPLLQRKQMLRRQAADAAAALRASTAAVDARRREMRAAAVAQAEVVACTLSAAGGDLASLMPPGVGFDALICDEAAQALEPSTLIPLQLLAPWARVVLVGDPRQLPATVVSRAAAAASLAQSLFERLHTAGYPVCMLSEQYRMHPAIAAWPSMFFYESKLTDAPGVVPGRDGSGGRAAPWHARACFPPLAFYDCLEGREVAGGAGGSVCNQEEAEVAYMLYTGLMERHRGEVGDVAILTPYQAQLSLLRRTFRQRGGSRAAEAVEFATVDGYQGREADVVIFSCVRARGSGSSVGFLADVRRMNVALTRARRSLWVIGHSGTLQGCPPWHGLLQHCRAQQRLYAAGKPYGRLLEARSAGELLADSWSDQETVVRGRR